MRVFLFEEPANISTKALDKFGEVVLMYEGNGYRPSIFEEGFEEACLDKLEEMNFNPKEDFFAVSGAVIPITLITHALSLTYTEFKFLIWHSHIRDYIIKIMRSPYE